MAGRVYRVGMLALIVLLWTAGASQAQIRGELCSKRDPGNPAKRHTGVILQANEDFYRMLLDGGERITLDAQDYELCRDVVAPPITQNPIPGGGGQADSPPPEKPKPPVAGPVDTNVTATLTMLGSGTIARGVMPKLIQAFARSRNARLDVTSTSPDTVTYSLRAPNETKPFLNIVVTATGSRTSLPALIDRKTQVGLSSSPYTDDEVAILMRLRGLTSRSQVEHVLALDGIVLVVHPSNPVRSLDLCDAAKIFSGKIRNWSAVGGPSAPIEAHSTYLSSGTFEVFQQLVLERCKETLGPVLTHTAQPEVRAAVEANRNAIGFLGKSELTHRVKALDIGGRCGLEIAPTSFNIKSEDYLLSRRLYVFTPYKVERNAEAFLEFALIDITAQEALKGEETTDQTIELADQQDRLRLSASLPENRDESFSAFRRDIGGMRRASISFRFQFGSDRLDTKAEADVLRLVKYLQENRHRRILLAGFADNVGSTEQNRTLATRRARAVEAAIARIDRSLLPNVQVKGYGKALPVSCNDNELGRYKNRRVEVWLDG